MQRFAKTGVVAGPSKADGPAIGCLARAADPAGKAGAQMKSRISGLLVLGACMAVTVALYASDMVGVYAVVDKVVLEPSETSPERVQIWGAFALADDKDGSSYKTAERGYLYYTCPQGKESICRKEWADLKSVAGKETGVGFGRRWESAGRVRKDTDKPATPDTYPIQMGVIKVEKASDRGAQTMRVIEGLRQALKPR
jgi:hypothetical protein